MVSSREFGLARHDDLLRAAQAAGHAFAPIEDSPDEHPVGASRRFLTLSAISLSSFAASYGAFLMMG